MRFGSLVPQTEHCLLLRYDSSFFCGIILIGVAFFSVGLSGAHGLSAAPTIECPFGSLVAPITRRGLLLCAKHLFVAATGL